MKQLEEWSKLQRILLWKLHISYHHVSWRKREGLDQEMLLWERYISIKVYRTIDQKSSIPTSHIWNHARHQEWPKDPGSGNKSFAGSGRSLFSRPIWRLQPVCYPCKMSHHHAKRCAVSEMNMQRENLEISWSATKTLSFSGPPTYFQSKYTWKAISVPSAQHRRVNHLSLTALHLTWWRPLENK